jgi:Ca2+-binding EF-hand superfamily protein
MSRKTYLERFATSHIGHLTGDELSEVWTHYDEDKDGYLTRGELDHLANAAVIRVEARLRGMLYKLVQEEWNKEGKQCDSVLVEQEVHKGLEHVFNAEAVAQAKLDLLRALDADHDGRVSKEEFFQRWNAFATRFEQAEALDEMCSIL